MFWRPAHRVRMCLRYRFQISTTRRTQRRPAVRRPEWPGVFEGFSFASRWSCAVCYRMRRSLHPPHCWERAMPGFPGWLRSWAAPAPPDVVLVVVMPDLAGRHRWTVPSVGWSGRAGPCRRGAMCCRVAVSDRDCFPCRGALRRMTGKKTPQLGPSCHRMDNAWLFSFRVGKAGLCERAGRVLRAGHRSYIG